MGQRYMHSPQGPTLGVPGGCRGGCDFRPGRCRQGSVREAALSQAGWSFSAGVRRTKVQGQGRKGLWGVQLALVHSRKGRRSEGARAPGVFYQDRERSPGCRDEMGSEVPEAGKRWSWRLRRKMSAKAGRNGKARGKSHFGTGTDTGGG